MAEDDTSLNLEDLLSYYDLIFTPNALQCESIDCIL